jgi:excinuclease ABC subunit C
MIDQDVLENIPRSPGVYLMKNARGRIIYIGKALNLRTRVRSYFSGSDTRQSVPFIAEKTERIEWLITNTEKEALILENNLIKIHRPRYNIVWRDDKTYISLRIDPTEKYPRISIVRVRGRVKDKAFYFGPYSSAGSVRETLRLLTKTFPLRTCTDAKMRSHTDRPCLQCQIKRCPGCCVNLITEEEYAEILHDAILFLQGKNRELVVSLMKKMSLVAEKLDFEEAAKVRDQIRAVERTVEKQRVVSAQSIDRDVFGLCREADEAQLSIMHIREGKLLDSSSYTFSRVKISGEEIVSSFINQFYSSGRPIPREIILPAEILEKDAFEEMLSERRERRVTIICPRRGEKGKLLEMANKNAQSALSARKDEQAILAQTLAFMQKRLRLTHEPTRIECFDISNIGGNLAVGSMVTFINGKKDSSRYRRYKVKTVSQPDDYAMIEEVLTRRLRRGKDSGDLPDLMVIDGGKGQLNVATKALQDLQIEGVDVISLAKDKSDWQPGKPQGEKIYLPNRKDPVILRSNSPVLFLIQRIRDEAHRFAITYHKRLRKKAAFRSALDLLPGIGPKRKRELLKRFGSVKRIKQASVEDLAAVPGMSRPAAEAVHAFFRQQEHSDGSE